MQAIVDPGHIRGNVIAPPSKSMMQRVCAAALLHKGKTIIHNAGVSDDDKAALQAIIQLGATVTYLSPQEIEITSHGVSPVSGELHCGESGLCARLFTPIAALSSQQITITGEGSLLARPMNEWEKVLPQLGVAVHSNNGALPLTVKGALVAKDITIDGSLSSQYVTGILFAMAAAATTKICITAEGLVSKPYIDLTLSILKIFGYHVMHEEYRRFYIDPALYKYTEEIDTTIEGDWSSAAFWLVGGTVAGNVQVHGLQRHSTQADKAVMQALEAAGAIVQQTATCIAVRRTGLQAFSFDANDCPDLFPALAVLASLSKGESVIHGVRRLIHKESNRIESIADMLEQFGTFYSVSGDALYIEGSRFLLQGVIQSYNDHRIIMAAAIASLRAADTIIINDAQAVSKSYPDFFSHLYSLGGYFTLTE